MMGTVPKDPTDGLRSICAAEGPGADEGAGASRTAEAIAPGAG